MCSGPAEPAVFPTVSDTEINMNTADEVIQNLQNKSIFLAAPEIKLENYSLVLNPFFVFN